MVMTLLANEIALGERVPMPALPTLLYRSQPVKAESPVKSVVFDGAAHPNWAAAVCTPGAEAGAGVAVALDFAAAG